MSRDLEGAVLLVVGTVLARITLEGSYLAYVKSNLFWPLVATSVILLFLGFATLRRQPSPAPAKAQTAMSAAGDVAAASVVPEGETSVAHPHGQHRPPRLGVLLLAPVLVLVLAAPPPLGAFAADRGQVNSIAQDFADDLPPLERAGDRPVELTISEFVLRTLVDGDASVRGVPVRLTGFVAEGEDGFFVSRFAIACCAADASPRQVHAIGEVAPVPADQWVEAVVRWDGPASGGDEQRIPEVRVLEIRSVDAPTQPYEYASY